jgi:hypothetical protein
MYYNMYSTLADHVEGRVESETSLGVIARVALEDRSTDLAIELDPGALGVVRCTSTNSDADCTALATMVAERTFVWAGLVYETLDHPGGVDGIESFHVSELDRLVARLVQLQEVYREAG